MDPASASLGPGSAVTLTATLRDADGDEILFQSVTWRSSDTSLATVAGTGPRTATVTGRGAGTATITASRGAVAGTATIQAQAPPQPLRIQGVFGGDLEVVRGIIQPYQLRHSGGTGTVRWQVGLIRFIPRDDGLNTVEVSESGVVTGVCPSCTPGRFALRPEEIYAIEISVSAIDERGAVDNAILPFSIVWPGF